MMICIFNICDQFFGGNSFQIKFRFWFSEYKNQTGLVRTFAETERSSGDVVLDGHGDPASDLRQVW